MDEQLPDSTRMAFLQRAVEGVPDLRRVRILDGVMIAKSGSSTTITYEGYYKLLQDASFHHDNALSEAPEGTKSRPMGYLLNPLKGLMITIHLLKMIPSPQLRKVP